MVYYSRRVPSGHDYLGIFRVMLRWKGSLYRILWKDLAVWLFFYFIISFVYRFALTPNQKRNFEDITEYISKWYNTNSITFILGFFVSQVLSRWWTMFGLVPWMNSPSFVIQSLIGTGKDPEGSRNIRLTMVRYLNLAWLLTFKNIGESIKKRCQKLRNQLRKERGLEIPNANDELDCLLEVDLELNSLNDDPEVRKVFGKIITNSEIETYKDIARQINDPNYRAQADYWVPLQWCSRLAKMARKSGHLESDRDYMEVVQTINGFRGQLGTFLLYADANVPLVYYQVVVIAVYGYVLVSLLSRQFLQPPSVEGSSAFSNSTDGAPGDVKQYDYYFPIFAILDLVFIVGWMRVAMILINPLGSDDEDFPLNMIFDYNMMISRRSAGNYTYQYPKKLREKIVKVGDTCETYDQNLTSHRHHFDSDSEGEPEIKLDQNKGINKAGGGLSVAMADLHDPDEAERKAKKEQSKKSEEEQPLAPNSDTKV